MVEHGIRKEPIRTEVARLLLERLLSGEIEPGARINESKLATELGVSRTPLREALIRLEFEGFVANEKGRGFIVEKLDPAKARQLYSLAGLLEGLALQESGDLPVKTLRKLEKIEDRRCAALKAHHRHEAVELDNLWHTTLVGRCGNSELLEMLSVLKRRLYRYEFILAERTNRFSPDSHHHHSLILKALADRNHALAVEQLKHHWEQGGESRHTWLKERESPQPDRWTSLM